ncbi:hypothetical protein B566_EDAN009424 [Ephemera danica]|nr:hypothetical protein B566_EDAN009424 [Ephemera danica]
MAVGKPNYLTPGSGNNRQYSGATQVPRDSLHVQATSLMLPQARSPVQPPADVTTNTPTPSPSIQPCLLLQVLRGAPSVDAQLQRNLRSISASSSSPHLRDPAATDSPELHLLPDPVENGAVPSSRDEWQSEKSTWRLQLDAVLRQPVHKQQQFSTNKQQGDNVTRTHISEYNYSNVDQLSSAVLVGHEMSMALPSGRNQRSAAVDPGVAASGVADLDESTVRNERSTNLSHLTGTARKIQMFVKNRHLQILPDGTVNGTSNDTSDFSKYHNLLLLSVLCIQARIFDINTSLIVYARSE